jgi:hypothetical protein
MDKGSISILDSSAQDRKEATLTVEDVVDRVDRKSTNELIKTT